VWLFGVRSSEPVPGLPCCQLRHVHYSCTDTLLCTCGCPTLQAASQHAEEAEGSAAESAQAGKEAAGEAAQVGGQVGRGSTGGRGGSGNAALHGQHCLVQRSNALSMSCTQLLCCAVLCCAVLCCDVMCCAVL